MQELNEGAFYLLAWAAAFLTACVYAYFGMYIKSFLYGKSLSKWTLRFLKKDGDIFAILVTAFAIYAIVLLTAGLFFPDFLFYNVLNFPEPLS